MSGLSPAAVGMAGGADLVISGTGFSDASGSQVRLLSYSLTVLLTALQSHCLTVSVSHCLTVSVPHLPSLFYQVRVCGAACAVTAASASSLTCTVPSKLRHAGGGGTSRIAFGATAEAAVNATSQYVAGLTSGGEGGEGGPLAVARGTVVGLAFGGLTSSLLPRGATVSR